MKRDLARPILRRWYSWLISPDARFTVYVLAASGWAGLLLPASWAAVAAISVLETLAMSLVLLRARARDEQHHGRHQ